MYNYITYGYIKKMEENPHPRPTPVVEGVVPRPLVGLVHPSLAWPAPPSRRRKGGAGHARLGPPHPSTYYMLALKVAWEPGTWPCSSLTYTLVSWTVEEALT